jgi:3-deoxy-D-manno-octulosonate 8-phosphate phosphatase (KDO 8-P phosphatase)
MNDLMKIKLLAMDVDGVLTDGTIYYGPQGDALKGFSARDGMGISLARAGGLKTAILTGRKSPMVEQRATDLHIDYLLEGVSHKVGEMKQLCEQLGLDLSEVAYMGDDLNDVELLACAGLGGAPQDACAEARAAAGFVSQYAGGHGALREFSEYILKGQQKWSDILQKYNCGRVDINQ